MMPNTPSSAEVADLFAAILRREGIDAPIIALDIEGFRDDPGFHWSNPGLKLATITAGGLQHPFVVKRLGHRSRREVPIYCTLSAQSDFPMPRLYHSVYDEATDDYLLVMEHGIPKPTAKGPLFWHEAGLLLARIHASFWNRTDELPSIFHTEQPSDQAWKAVQGLVSFFDEQSPEAFKRLEREAAPTMRQVRATLANVDCTRLPSTPPRARCLVHRAFHAPEMLWRQTDTDYVPLAVDWETARVGAPEEDFGVVSGLIAHGETECVQALRGTYFQELRQLGIMGSADALWDAILHQTLLDRLRLLPWLLGQYLQVRDDSQFVDWCRWARGELPLSLAYVQRAIEQGTLDQTP